MLAATVTYTIQPVSCFVTRARNGSVTAGAPPVDLISSTISSGANTRRLVTQGWGGGQEQTQGD